MEATMSQKLTWAEQQELEQEQRVERWAFSTAVERIRELSGEASYEITDRDTQAEFYDGYRSADDKYAFVEAFARDAVAWNQDPIHDEILDDVVHAVGGAGTVAP